MWVNWVHEALHDWIKNSEAVFTKNERRELRKKGQTKEEKNEFGTENTEKRKTSNEGLQNRRRWLRIKKRAAPFCS